MESINRILHLETDESKLPVNVIRFDKDNADNRLGDVCLSLRYVPAAGNLTIVVVEARDLKKMDAIGSTNPCVKVVLALNCGGGGGGGSCKRVKKKTPVKKCSLNPYYNEWFTFEVPPEHIQIVQLEISVIHYEKDGGSEWIGKVELGCSAASESGLNHWIDMLASPRRLVTQWHTLKCPDSEPGGLSRGGSIKKDCWRIKKVEDNTTPAKKI